MPSIMANGQYKKLPDTSTPLLPDDNATGGLNRLYKIAIALGLDQDTYSTSKNYAVGDMVIHDFRIWKCTTACSGEWNESKWTVVPIIV